GIDEHQRQWIASQDLFFVGTAPLAGDGHVNVSPKGPIGSLAVLDASTVAYPGSAEFDEVLSEADFTQPEVLESRRSIIVVDVTRVSDSCGYGVPLMD